MWRRTLYASRLNAADGAVYRPDKSITKNVDEDEEEVAWHH